MATATLPRPPAVDEGNLWQKVEEICRNVNPTPTTPDPNAELRAQLMADGATTILGILPETTFDQLCDRFGLFRFDKPKWVNKRVVDVWTSTSPRYLTADRTARRTARRTTRLADLIVSALCGANTVQDESTTNLERLLTLWPTRNDAVPKGHHPMEGYMVPITLALPLTQAFKDQRTLAKHGHRVGVAAVPGALAVEESEVQQVILARKDPFAFVRCTRTDGTRVVAIIDQNGHLPGEQAILDWVRDNTARAA